MSLSAEAEQAIFTAFLGSRKIVIVDSSAAVRTGIISVFKDLGAKLSQVVSTSSYSNALKEIQADEPAVVLCDYWVDSKHGLRLIAAQHERIPDGNRRISFLITGNTRESAIAEAAEGDVDCYILKPFTLTLLKAYLLKTVQSKLKPGPYQISLDRGRALLKQSKLDEAIQAFMESLPLHPKPALAHYFLGHTHHLKKQPARAEGDYRRGLAIYDMHYRCLSGLFDLLSESERTDEAYDIARRLLIAYPVTARRLERMLRVIVREEAFEEVPLCYELFTGLDERSEYLSREMTLALIAAGSRELMREKVNRDLAMEFFQKAMVIAERNPEVLHEIVMRLIGRKLFTEADTFLKEFPPIRKLDLNYLSLELAVLDGTAEPGVILAQGHRLLQGGVETPLVYEIMIRRSREVGHEDSAESLYHDACRKFPEDRARFEQAFTAD